MQYKFYSFTMLFNLEEISSKNKRENMTFFVCLRYFFSVIFHKICILISGYYINKILSSTSYQVSYRRLLLHDLSKFSSSEFWPYAEHFYGEKKHEDQFHQAWFHHVQYNDHHYEHFIENYPSFAKLLWANSPIDSLIIHEMPDEAIVEMIADNLAASRSYEGQWPESKQKDGWKWMTNSFQRFKLHPNSQMKFVALLCALGYAQVLPNDFDWTSIKNANISNDEKIKLLQLEKLAQLNN